MAGEGGEETEYESDPEEAKMSLKMRRREASDDEDEDEVEERVVQVSRDGVVDSEVESDGQGAAAEYDDEGEEEYYDEQGEYEEEEEGGVVFDGIGVTVMKAVGEAGESGKTAAEEGEVLGGEGEGEKKENEPFAVPTAGAFYMHDDRFKDNSAGRHRRTLGGRKLWESKDERKWGHDKFEEMNTDDKHDEEGRRSSRGSYQGRGRARGPNRGFGRGGRVRGYDGNNHQSAPPKDVRGRGPRRYQPSMKNKSDTVLPHNKQLTKSLDRSSHTGSRRVGASMANLDGEHEPAPAKKVASNLNSASPPFYPSASSNKEAAPKKEIQAGNHDWNNCPSSVNHNFSMPHSNYLLRGKNAINSVGMDKLHIDDTVSPANVKPLSNVQFPSSVTPSIGVAQMTQSRSQERGVAPSGSAVFRPQTNNQVNKVSPPAAQAPQRIQGQPSLQASGQQLQCPPGGSQSSSPPKSGKGSAQGTGRAALVYGGGPGGNHLGSGDPNLPAFFPVMQFGSQHPGGIGVPAVGMAFPGYVAQPNGLGNSEMTWLPVLASAAGGLGAPYCSPYLAVDGSFNPRPTRKTSALPAPSKDNNSLSNPSNESKPPQRSGKYVANDEFSQRQNKPRRYSEMNFSQ